ncbi:MAG TPA: site-specific DNA-methyltransferase [Gemmataceae bacterium]|nr:site-specific DNA-methyltransferase [Gemmataceae bacterium]
MPTKTELIWEGKYDDKGQRTAPLRVALPFQTVETINESAQERDRGLFQYAAQEQPWRNRLIWGDKKYVLPSLLAEFAGKVDLIYIDPPFDTGADFSFTAAVPGADDEDDDALAFTKQPSIIEQKAYRDTWGRGLDSYLQWFYETAVLLHELLAETGSLYVHLDWRMVHYAKLVLDEVFGIDRYENEIVWQRSLPHGNVDYKFGASHDTILRYSKSEQFTWHPQYMPHREEYLRDFYKYSDPDGRIYRLISCINPNPNRPNLTYEWRGIKKVWKYTKDRMQRMHDEGLLVYSKNGIPSYKGYLDEMKGVPAQDIWTDIPPVMGVSREWTDYPTQKPEALLDRILRASSNEGDLVLDCFCGSGTTAAVAEKLNRRWLACDLGRFAIHTTRKRLLQIPGVKPFVVQNLGKYERQRWQSDEFAAASDPSLALRAGQVQRAYVEFILQLYGAAPLHGYTWLHGTKGGRPVHVGGVEAPVSVGDVSRIAAEFKKAMGSGKDAPTSNGVDVLGWDFAFEVNEVARQQAEAANLRLNFKRIPRDVMDKRAVAQGDIHFFELAALGVDVKARGRAVTLALADFVIPPDDVPEDVRAAVKHWAQWIDYWAVDWDNKGDAFHNEWQTFRTRKEGKLALTASHTYAEPGEYRVVVKVIDILGNDTTKTVKVKVK